MRKGIIVLLILSLSFINNVAYSNNTTPILYEGKAVQPLLCYINTGEIRGLRVERQGSAHTFLARSYKFGARITIDTGNATYRLTVPKGEYGKKMITIGIADDLYYPGSGGRISVLIDTGHDNSLTAIRIGSFSYFDGKANGIVWFRLDVEWSNDRRHWNVSNIYYNVSVEEEKINVPQSVFFARGRFVRINITMIWAPDSGNRNTANAFFVAFIDSIISMCFPFTPEAMVKYRIYEYYTEANVSLGNVVSGVEDYIAVTYRVKFPIETRMALYTVDITDARLEIDGYNLSFIIDENGNPLPFKIWDNGAISIIVPMLSQNITLIYLKNGKQHGSEWLPPDGVVWFFDFGDAIEGRGVFQGWKGYGTYYQTYVSTDTARNDLSLTTYLKQRVYLASGGWYKNYLVLPPGNYYVGANILVDYSYFNYFYGKVDLIFFFRENDGTYRSSYLLSGRYTSFDGTVYGNITAKKWGDQVYFTVRSSYSNRGSTLYIRWAYIIGVPSVDYGIAKLDEKHIKDRRDIRVNGVYYAVLPWFNSTELYQFDSKKNTGYIKVEAGGTTSFEMRQNSRVIINITQIYGSDPNYAPNIVIVPPGGSIKLSVEISAPYPSQYILPDPPLANTPILFAILTPEEIFDNTSQRTDDNGQVIGVVLNVPSYPNNNTLVVVPLAWPYTIPYFIPLYTDTITVVYDNSTIYMSKNSNKTIGFYAEYTNLKLPFIGTITFTTSSTSINVTNTSNTDDFGNGNMTIYSQDRSGRYSVSAVNGIVSGITYPATGELDVIVTGAHIIITVSPEGPPWFVYDNLTWTVKAVYDDGTEAVGNGSISVEKDHYKVSNESWNGEERNVTLTEIGYDSYLEAVLEEPTGEKVFNYSLVVAIPRTNGTANSTLGGIELMSFHIEPYQQAGLKDGLITIILIALALAPFYLRKYAGFFKGSVGRIIWASLLLGLTLIIMIGRARIPVDAYITQTENGTTLIPVYKDNPFIKIYTAPLMIELLIIIYETINIITRLGKPKGWY